MADETSMGDLLAGVDKDWGTSDDPLISTEEEEFETDDPFQQQSQEEQPPSEEKPIAPSGEGGGSEEKPEENKNKENKSEEKPQVGGDLLEYLSNNGHSYNTQEEVLAALNKQPEKPEIPKEIESAMKWLESGKKFTDYAKQFAVDFEGLDGKQNQFEIYRRNNPDMPAKLQEMEFSNAYKQKYGKLLEYEGLQDGDEKNEFYAENKDLIDYQKELRGYDDEKAKTDNLKWLEDSTSKITTDKQEQMSEEELEKLVSEFATTIKGHIDAYKGYELPFGDKAFNVGLSDESKAEIQKIAGDPREFSKLIGEAIGGEDIAITGNMKDYGKYIQTVHLLKTFQNPDTLKQLSDWVLENKKLETIEASRQNPLTEDPNSSSSSDGEPSIKSLLSQAQL